MSFSYYEDKLQDIAMDSVVEMTKSIFELYRIELIVIKDRDRSWNEITDNALV